MKFLLGIRFNRKRKKTQQSIELPKLPVSYLFVNDYRFEGIQGNVLIISIKVMNGLYQEPRSILI